MPGLVGQFSLIAAIDHNNKSVDPRAAESAQCERQSLLHSRLSGGRSGWL